MTKIYNSPIYLPLAPGIRTPSARPAVSKVVAPQAAPTPLAPYQTISNSGIEKFSSAAKGNSTLFAKNNIKTLAEQQANPPKPGTVDNPTEVPEKLLTQNGSWVLNPLLAAKAKAPKTIVDSSGQTVANPALNYIAAKSTAGSQQNLPAFIVGADGRWIANPNIKPDAAAIDNSPTAQGTDLDILLPSGKVYTKTGDIYSVSELIKANLAPKDNSGNGIVSYSLALRDAATGGVGKGGLTDADGTLLRPGLDGTYSLSPQEFEKLRLVTRDKVGTDQLIIVAASGTIVPGTTTPLIQSYSKPLEIDFVNGATRSANGSPALVKYVADSDPTSNLTKEANIYSLTSVAQKPLVTVPSNDIGLKSGSSILLSDLFKTRLPDGATNQSLSSYVLAFSDANFGKVYTTNGTVIEPDAKGLITLTADQYQFARLEITDRTLGNQASLSLSAVSTKTVNGTSSLATVYSNPTQINLTVESRNSAVIAGQVTDAPPVIGAPAEVDGYGYLIRQAAIKKDRNPREIATLTTSGTVQVGEGDRLILGELIQTTKAAASNSFVDSYRIALGRTSTEAGAPQLYLDNRKLNPDSNGVYSVTKDQLARVQLDPGWKGAVTELYISAVNKVLPPNTNSSFEFYSPVANLTVAVSGVNSLNGAKAIVTAAGQSDSFKQIATASQIGLGKTPEQAIAVGTVGSFNAIAGDQILVGDLFSATKASRGEITNYYLALRDSITGDGKAANGQLLLDGQVVGGAGVAPENLKTSFTRSELDRLVYQFSGRADDFIFAASAPTYDSKGNSVGQAYSQAVSITASLSGDGLRSLNVAEAVRPPAPDPFFAIASRAEVFRGGANADRGLVSTVGNFETTVGAQISFADLVQGKAPTGGTIDAYHIGIKAGGNNAEGAVSGALVLDGKIVAGAGFVASATQVSEKTSFTSDELYRLTYRVGDKGTRDDFIVSTSSKKFDSRGNQLASVYSPAVQFNNQVSGANSLSVARYAGNVNPDLVDGFTRVARLSQIYKGTSANPSPVLTTIISGDDAGLSGSSLINLTSVGAAALGSRQIGFTSVEGLQIGQLVTSSYLPNNTIITGIDATTKTVTFSQGLSREIFTTGDFIFTDRTDNPLTLNSLQGGAYKDVTLVTTAAKGDRVIRLNSVLGLTPGQALIGSLIQDGTVITAVNLLDNSITLSKPLQTGLDSVSTRRITADANKDDFTLGFDSLDGLAVGQRVTSSLLPPGTVITALDYDNNLVTLSNGLLHATVVGEGFAIRSAAASLAGESLTVRGTGTYRPNGSQVGQSTSTVKLDPTLSSSIEFGKLSRDSSGVITGPVAPNQNIYASQLLLFNSRGIGGYQSSDRSSYGRLIALSSLSNPVTNTVRASGIEFTAPAPFLPYNRFIP
ncbi:MAG: hypothetical protein QM523_04005 [Candidatus Pacebacteria bacterium]|nr:hypothetical protein [Candidatus Paceibacterota bacterium]